MWAAVWWALAAAQLSALLATPLDPAPTSQGVQLSPFVRHWEPARYEPARGAGRRRDRRRAPAQPPPLRFSFRAHNRDFNLLLRPDPSSVFAEGAHVHGSGARPHFDLAQVYSGTLEDEESSHVYGVVTAEGLFDGTIETPSEEYYVEPLARWGRQVAGAHSAIYRLSDVLQPPAPPACASHQLHRRRKRWLPEDEGMQEDEPRKNPALPLDLDVPYSRSEPSTRRPKTQVDKTNLITKVRHDEDSRPKPKTHVEVIKTKAGVVVVKDVVRKEPVGFTVLNASDDGRHVNKRAVVDPRKTTCLVYLQADHMFYQRYGSEEACIEVMTRHVQKVNAIYKVTDFNQDGKPDNITFMIKRIKVHTLDALKDPAYRFPNNYGVEKYLELFSEEDYDAFCLAYMFTYRDFEMGTLGLAWTGDLKNAGGVCEKNGHYRGSMKSLNTGIVTLLNYGKHVPPAVSHVTLAHEIGHNFGSPHDPEVCTPFGEDGNYIMFARATSGDRRNNNKFSPCSLRAIDPVLNNKARSPKGCFTEPQPAICGNGVVEEGEECDCGWVGECSDTCCRPQAPRPHYKPCTLTERSVCSPSQGPCCTAGCTLKFGDKCRSDNGCRDAAYCDGKRAFCPTSRHKPNRTRCEKELVCYMGECTGSICLAYGLESCQCGAEAGAGADAARAACELCCRAPGGPCRSSFAWNTPPYDVPDMYAKPGTPCNQYSGYCDVFQRCREVDPSGPLATLRKLLLSDESIASFKRWLLEHWYAAVLAPLCVIALLVASTRWLGRRANKLKSVTIIHSATTETVRLPDQPGVIVHTAIRSKLPLKKKVALRTRAYRKQKDPKQADKASPAHNQSKKRKPITAKPEESRAKVKTAVVTTGEGKPPKHIVLSKHKGKGKKRKGKVKKTIDYSAAQGASGAAGAGSDALGKVQEWLLRSPQPPVLPKSKSTPTGLAERAHRQHTPSARKARPSKSATNLLDQKARLQVLFKPPFRFSVKICKGDKTKVVLDKSRPDVDRKRNEVFSNASNVEEFKMNTSNTKPPKLMTIANAPEENIAAPPKLAMTAYPSYANLLPRSASDCKVDKKLTDYRLKHKKSNSVGQKKETTESRQNLLSKEDLESGSHFYENVVMAQEPYVPRSCSMPRRPHRNSTNNLSKPPSHGSVADLNDHFYNTIETLKRNPSAGNLTTNTGSSSGSSRAPSAHLQARPSGARRRPAHTSRQHSLVDKSSHTAEPGAGKLRRQLSENEIANRTRRTESCSQGLRGFQLVVGKERLKRQLSEQLGSSHGVVCMPEPLGRSKRASLDCEASLQPREEHRTPRPPLTFGELKHTLPGCTDRDVQISPEEFLKIIDN